jgi:hypothetical protein
MKHRVSRGLLVAAATIIVLGAGFYLMVLPFVTDSLSDLPDW